MNVVEPLVLAGRLRIDRGHARRGRHHAQYSICVLGLHCLRRAMVSGEIFSGNLTFCSDSAWLTESHWSSFLLPGNANSSASKSTSHDARSGRNTWPASNLAETTAMRLTLSPSGLTAIMPETLLHSS